MFAELPRTPLLTNLNFAEPPECELRQNGVLGSSLLIFGVCCAPFVPIVTPESRDRPDHEAEEPEDVPRLRLGVGRAKGGAIAQRGRARPLGGSLGQGPIGRGDPDR